MQMKSFSFKTADGVEHWINRWIPDEETGIKGVVVLNHGLAEHSLRYDRFGSILAENGYVLNAFDMRGHGKTAEIAVSKREGYFGKLADKDGFNRVVEDLYEIIEDAKKTYEGKPVVLMGHSFGSFVSQAYVEKYGKLINACILSGTAGPRNGMIALAGIAVGIIKLFKGKDAFVPLLSDLSFGSYNNHIKDSDDPNAWLSVNKMNVEMYNADQWCGFPLPVCFYSDMVHGLKMIHKASNMKKIPVDLPVHFIYGTEDPVGSYGKTIEKLIKIYKANGLKDVTERVYEGKRHELLNEDNKEEVENELLEWLNKTIA